ncbi:Ankyrin repeats domain-containing protein [Phytophthora infestans]|uniref:Ankyrin repeats domain-containing protein n=1 Tax=Phytophthora infestans TaxID=4787 RepID=A0A8S9U8H8_PHYIN|nr:Ankyrin repeats domain-containing protein [Phytophthora infestans]
MENSTLLFTSVAVICRSYPSIGALSHITQSIDAYLDPSTTWTIPDACRFGSVRLLDRLAARTATNADKEGNLEREFQLSVMTAMQVGYVEVVQWLIRRYPEGQVPSKAVAEAAKNGHLLVLQWLFTHHDHVYWGGDEMYCAVANNHLDVAKFLHEFTAPPPDDMFLIDEAARHGDLEMMQWLHSERGDQLTYEGVMRAVDLGYLDAVQWMMATFSESVVIKDVRMENAAANGHLEMIKWLHWHQAWCTKQAINRAAGNGHLEMVKGLDEQRSEGCTTDAMDLAASNGHLEVVKWLHENRSEGCTQFAMDMAAKNGFFSVLKWLHDNRNEGCSTHAMDYAAAAGRLNIVRWLHEHCAEGCTRAAMADAIANGHLDIARWLQGAFPDKFGV